MENLKPDAIGKLKEVLKILNSIKDALPGQAKFALGILGKIAKGGAGEKVKVHSKLTRLVQ